MTMNCKNCPVFSKSVFSSLSEEQLNYLEKNKTIKNYNRGDLFSVKDKPATEIYCLMSGSAKVTLTSRNKSSLVRLAEPGKMLGYRCVFSNEKYRGTASALVKSTACQISKDVFFNLIQKSSQFSLKILTEMGHEIANSEAHHQSFCLKNVRERLAEALIILVQKFGVTTENGIVIETRLTRSELANWIGTARETVIRELTSFSVDQLIKVEESQIIILNLPELKIIADFDPETKTSSLLEI